MQIAGVIIAGGKGSRLGGRKPSCRFHDATLLDAVIARARPQVEELALNLCAADMEHYRDRGLELLQDGEEGDIGPLAGVLAGLAWAERRGATWLATFPSDTPFLPRDLVRRLLAVSCPAAAHDGARLHGLCAVWPVGVRALLSYGVREEGIRSLRQAIGRLGGAQCVLGGDAHAFFNVNTPEDLMEAERIVANASDLDAAGMCEDLQ